MFFPDKKIDQRHNVDIPSIVLNGNRFHIDQTSIELLAEFLMVINAKKRINGEIDTDDLFPSEACMHDFSEMTYSINHRLYFKLFSLWTTGKQPKGGESHAYEYEHIIKQMSSCFEDNSNPERNLEILSNLYQGFQVAGATRDWSARSFLPLSKNLITGETIWGASAALKNKAGIDFEQAKEHFSHNKRVFYARGGEVLYLQLLLFFTKSKEDVIDWKNSNSDFWGMKISDKECDPVYLKSTIQEGFTKMYSNNSVPSGFDSFITLVEEVNSEERERFNYTDDQQVGFIPTDTWCLGFLFALDLSRLFQSQFSSMELLKELELECAFHSFRTMIFQSSSYLKRNHPVMAVVSDNCEDALLKTVSRRSFENVQQCIKNAYETIARENEEYSAVLKPLLDNPKELDKIHKEYGYYLFRKHAKDVGFVIPRTGGNEHFVINKDILVLLVSTTLVPGDSLTLESFLNDLRIRWGLVFDSDGFSEVNKDSGIPQKINDSEMLNWLIQMLDECGYYVSLSDSISLVKNTNIPLE